MAWHVSNSAGILASRFHSNSFTTLPLYASEAKAAAEVKAAPEERDPPAPAPLDREALLRKVPTMVRHEAVHHAALFEHRMQSGSKPIFHLEAFIAKFMSVYKKHVMSAF